MYISVNSHSVEHDKYTYHEFKDLLKGLATTIPKSFQIKGTDNIFKVQNIGIIILNTLSINKTQTIATLSQFNEITDIINKHPNSDLKIRIILNGISKDIVRDENITNTIIFDNTPGKIWGCKTYTMRLLNNSLSIIFSDISIKYHFFDQLTSELTNELIPNFDARFKTQNIEHFISCIQDIIHFKVQKSRLIDIFLFVIRSQQDIYKKTFDALKIPEKYKAYSHQNVFMFPHMLDWTSQSSQNFYFTCNSLIFSKTAIDCDYIFTGKIQIAHNFSEDIHLNSTTQSVKLLQTGIRDLQSPPRCEAPIGPASSVDTSQQNTECMFWITNTKKTAFEIIGICLRIARVFKIDNNFKIYCPLVELIVLQYIIKDINHETLNDPKKRHELHYIIQNIEVIDINFVKLFVENLESDSESDLHIKNILSHWLLTQEKMQSQ